MVSVKLGIGHSYCFLWKNGTNAIKEIISLDEYSRKQGKKMIGFCLIQKVKFVKVFKVLQLS